MAGSTVASSDGCATLFAHLALEDLQRVRLGANERRIGERRGRARPRRVEGYDLRNSGRPLGEQQDLVGQINGLLEVVRDEDHRRLGTQEYFLQLFPD